MLLLHLGIPPSGHGYAPPIAVAIITVLAKKGCTVLKCICAFITPLPLLCQKNFPSMAKNRIGFSICPEKTRRLSGASKLSKETPAPLPLAERSCQLAQHVFLFLFTNPEFPFQKPVIASLAIGLEPSSLPPVSGISFHKRKGRKSVLNIRGWTPSLLFPVELVMFLTMFPFIKEIRLFVPAHGAVNQTGDVFF